MTEFYAGLDVSDKTTHICAVDTDGKVAWRGVCVTDPEIIATQLNARCPDLVRVVLETGTLSSFLYHGLLERGLPVVCICARHAKGVLSVQVNKSDVHDAEGLAQMARTGWFKAVHMKDSQTHLDRARLKMREQMVRAHNTMVNQMRGLLKLFGLRLGGSTTPGMRNKRLDFLFRQKPELRDIFAPMITSLTALEAQIKAISATIKRRAQSDAVCERLMTVPGVGPITAMTYICSIEDPKRFAHGCDAGAYAGLAPRRFQSGERDTKGHISKAGDRTLRHALYEAANNLLCRVKRPFALQTWGKALALAKGGKRARVAVARKLAALLHKLWLSGERFDWEAA
ncbi:IS110 family transposase [Asticcacaulis solisilvae]|uniref:IS110 family transposase n=1 Tax=Asticcacaulis solisilvae TaxID=1217274 RepID=UPI003FD89B7A